MATAEITEPQADAHAEAHDHPEWLAHHFETPQQQFEAGKLGIWLFLAQEVLFFSGLFVAYAVYRANHPEVFLHAHHFLNPTLGALNTIVLLASSLAVAWGVRAVMTNQQSVLLWMHIFTLACAGFFLGVKVVEYSYKFDEGLYWAGYDREYGHWANGLASAETPLTDSGFHTYLQPAFMWSTAIGLAIFLGGWLLFRSTNREALGKVLVWLGVTAASVLAGLGIAAAMGFASGISAWAVGLFSAIVILSLTYFMTVAVAATSHMWGAVCVGLGLTVLGMAGGIVVANGVQQMEHHADHDTDAAHGDAHHAPAEKTLVPESNVGRPANAGNFFSIYFAMTGVHALHIIAGIIAISWIVGRIARGDFGPARYGPVEYVGLYWHLVDLVWIYLFPLLYLIH